MTTKAQRDEWMKICDAATKGPWIEDDGHIHSEPLSRLAEEWVIAKIGNKSLPCKKRPEHEVALCSQEHDNFQADADFVVMARTAMPDLIKEVNELEKERDVLKAELEDCRAKTLDECKKSDSRGEFFAR